MNCHRKTDITEWVFDYMRGDGLARILTKSVEVDCCDSPKLRWIADDALANDYGMPVREDSIKESEVRGIKRGG